MQNPYVADIGDYVKLAILRALAPGRRLGVVWWAFPDEPRSGDGGHREYLKRPREWKRFDPELFEVLLRIEAKKRRDIRALEEANILRSAVFASDKVPCEVRPFSLRPVARSKWLAEIKSKLKGCNLVFLDPDNGIGPEGLRLTWRRAGKSVTIEEVASFQEGCRGIVVYHHQTRFRSGHSAEIKHLAARLKKCGLRVSGALRAKPWAPRVFFILNADKELCNRAKRLAELWENRISWHPDAAAPRALD
jgi:hypothetical protein